ncbi:MAG: carboxypeptidase regulatory-like domain-containing protein [Planctomycetes bacterium]|nr:carboxypeptidase regulatory-like domain-containing protein [Planctomycetota bacterium]
MRPFRGAALVALAVLAAAEVPARAAWNNVFQVSCFHRRRVATANFTPCCPTPVVAAAPVIAAASPCPCPPPVCTTQYVQRSYYEPVTTYKAQTVLEPVTTYQTSYCLEPVCSYHYSCYYDPCTCSYQQVATPVTSYRVRSQCNAVTSYLQRCQMVPVQSYRLSYRLEPVQTCCTPVCPTPCCNGGTPAVGTIPSTPTVPSQPGVGEQQQPVVPVQPLPAQKPIVGEQTNPGGTGFRRFPGETPPPPMPNADGSSFRQPRVPAPPPQVHFDRIASLPGRSLEGRVLDTNRAPQAGARLLFVSADTDGRRQSSTADGEGNFRATLANGSWLVYVRNRDGVPVFQAKIDVTERPSPPLTLVSR